MELESHLLGLYDRYLDSVIGGVALPPSDFLRQAGVADSALLDRLEQLYRLSAPGSPTRGEGGRDVDQGEPPRPRQRTHNGLADHPDAAHQPRLGEFILRERLGEGGMGVVHLAEQPSMGRLVALKVIRPEFAQSANAAARFDAEARAIARLRHPNIVTVYAVGEDRGVRYLAMEHIEGATLSEVLGSTEHQHSGASAEKESTVPLPTILGWMAAMARALHYAHEHNILHRDVKPSNIRITPDGRPLLLDFGLARDLSSGAATLTEHFVGSPHYVAPEQIGRGRSSADGRADVYSLGVVLYECITGSPPFRGDSLEQVLHSILTHNPPPPRSVKGCGRTIPRDLNVIVMKAIEKDPNQRYASASELADDLEALVEFRPIRARPPGMVQRGWKWCRRHPAACTGGFVVALAVIAIASILAIQHAGDQRQRRAEANESLAQAAALVEQYREGRAETEEHEAQYEALRRAQATRYFTPEEDRLLAEAEDGVIRARNHREQAFYEVQRLLERGERLGAANADVQNILADLYLARYLDAALVNDPLEQSIYLDLVRRHDPHGRLEDELTGAAPVRIVSDPPGAAVHLFRLAETPEGRVVPVPWRGWPAALDEYSPGDWALRVVRGGAGGSDIRAGDLILDLAGFPVRSCVLVSESPASGPVQMLDRLVAIDGWPVADEYDARRLGAASEGGGTRGFEFERGGQRFVVHGESLAAMGVSAAGARVIAERGGVSARVWRDGVVSDIVLPDGLSVRVTAAPAFIGPDAFLGQSPVEDAQIEAGVYLLVLLRDDHENLRHPLHLLRGSPADLLLTLAPLGSTPEGWVRVPAWVHASPLGKMTSLASHPGREFWIMEREVTMREYFEFLNDPATLAVIDDHAASVEYTDTGALIRVPRVVGVAPLSRHADDSGGGRFALPEDWSWEWPVFGVSWYDAVAFAEWKTNRARAAGGDETYALPTLEEWTYAAGHTNHRYAFGSRFHPKWVSSCFSRPGPPIPGALGPKPEPPMSFPIDESIFGVFDTAGSVSEWIDDWWIEEARMRRHAGGSWAHGDPEELFAIYGGNGARPEITMGTIGFRLVMRRPSRDNAAE